MGRKRTNRMVTIGGMAAIAVVVGLMVALWIADFKNGEFRNSINGIALDTIDLTREYKKVEDSWLNHSQDNSTMASTFEQYKQKYQQLIDKAKALDAPDKYKAAKGYLIESIDLEMQSNQHFYNYLKTGDDVEKKKADELATQSNEAAGAYDSEMKK